MKTELSLLMELQSIDDRFRDLEVSKGTLPMELKKIQKSFADLKQRRSGAETAKSELSVEVSKREKKADECKEKISALQERLFQTQTNQEYEAVTKEIDYQQELLASNDTALNRAMETLTETEAELGTSAEELKELEEKLAAMKARSEEFNQKTAAKSSELQGERDGVADKLPKRLLAHYERIRQAKDGRGVVQIARGSSCGGCFHRLPPQTINQIRKMNDLILCETCGRVLVSDLIVQED